MNDIKYPIKLIATAAIFCIAVMFVTTWVSHSGYHTLLEAESDEVRLHRLHAKLWKRESEGVGSVPVLTEFSEIPFSEIPEDDQRRNASDSKNNLNKNYKADKELIASIKEAIDNKDLSKIRDLAIITERAATTVSALENQSKFLQRAGRAEEAEALLASKGYLEQNQIIVNGLNRIVGMIHDESTSRIENQKKPVSNGSVGSAAGDAASDWCLVDGGSQFKTMGSGV